ncbi:hypothetical protein [uncultured Dysgonomonas sp.]|uniref:Uncharacterized protein n=1 Tax=uncultured Dysgonomonas sp. TaxID=206096 RepID=A0A212IXZ7_9BACT|nr:hypothetical protein [uncultured Dysgonomonas sp.]SBV92086.1 hypothetical protein KL86DYS1_10515 [uncultured Dysgonomonas sp.]
MKWYDQRMRTLENMMDYQARIYYGAELTPEQKKQRVEAQKRAENLRELLFGSVQEEMTKHFELINDRIQKSIKVGGSAVFIYPYTNHVINTAHTMEEYFRLASDNGNAIIVYNRPDGTFIPNNEPIRE